MGRSAVAASMLGFLCGAVPAMPALADAQCSPRQTVVDYLSEQFHELPIGIGIANNGGIVELLVNREAGSWTILITLPDGQSCMMAAGKDWETLPVLTAEADPGA